MPFPGALCGEDLLPLHVRRLLSRLRLGHDGVSVVEVFELWKAREGSSLDRALVFAGGHRQGQIMWGGVPGVPATFAKSQTWRWTNEIVKFGRPGRRCSGFSPVRSPCLSPLRGRGLANAVVVGGWASSTASGKFAHQAVVYRRWEPWYSKSIMFYNYKLPNPMLTATWLRCKWLE